MTLSPRPTRLRAPQLLVGGIALTFLGLLPAAPAHAAAPQLSVAIDDGQSQVRSGDTTRYTLTVTNLGGKAVRDLHVTQTVPSGSEVSAVGHDGAERKGTLRWSLNVPAGRSVTVTSSLRVAEDLPPDLFRLATVACAATSPDAAPIVCASDSDELPAGAAALQQQPDAPAAVGRPVWLLPSVLGTGVLAVALAVALVLARRRRSGEPAGGAYDAFGGTDRQPRP